VLLIDSGGPGKRSSEAASRPEALRTLTGEIIQCSACPRLVAHREEIGRIKRRAYLADQYWCKPVPGFGDPLAKLFIVGLAPGAHGANRTGRVFTGDRSGEFLYRALHETGFANQSLSLRIDDGLRLNDAYIAAAVRCVPPDNKPNRDEILNCRPYLARELALFRELKAIVALGAIAFDAYLSILQQSGVIHSRSALRFGHGVMYRTHAGGPVLVGCYHPSQQNTSTKRLTREMLRDLFENVRSILRRRSDGGPGVAER
jgi:uracil-DNA glycosylase family 4